jgi:hypothetical protein
VIPLPKVLLESAIESHREATGLLLLLQKFGMLGLIDDTYVDRRAEQVVDLGE